jgi:hypothetical protein
LLDECSITDTYTLYTHCVCTAVCIMSSQLEKLYHYETRNCLYHVESVGKAVLLRDAKHFVYIIRLSNIFMIKQKKSCKFHWIYYLKKSKQRGTIVYVTNIVTSHHSNNSKIRWDFPDGDSAMFTITSLGFSRIPNLGRHESSSD